MKQTTATLLLLLGFYCQGAFAFSYTMEITQAELQQQLETMMPIQHREALLSINLRNPLVGFVPETHKISLQSLVETTAFGNLQANAVIQLAGNIVYRADEGAFYLRNIEVLHLESTQIQQQHVTTVKRISTQALNQLLLEQPVYTLQDANTRERLAKAVLKDVTVQGNKLVLTLGM